MSNYLFDFKYSIYKKGRVIYMNQIMNKILEDIHKIDKIYFMEQKGINNNKLMYDFPSNIGALEKYKIIKKLIYRWIKDLDKIQEQIIETRKINNIQSLFINE